MKKKVMIVEDNELNMKLFRDLIQNLGYETIERRSGLDMIEITRKEKPDLILMDIQLPRMSGLDIIKILKVENDLKSIPVIAITAFAMKDEEEHILKSGCQEYMSKPIQIPDFLKIIQKYLS